MKLNPDFKTQITKDEHITIAMPGTGFNGFFRTKDTAAFIIDCLQTDTTQAEIVDKVLDKYDVDRETAEKDVARIIAELDKIGAIVK